MVFFVLFSFLLSFFSIPCIGNLSHFHCIKVLYICAYYILVYLQKSSFFLFFFFQNMQQQCFPVNTQKKGYLICRLSFLVPKVPLSIHMYVEGFIRFTFTLKGNYNPIRSLLKVSRSIFPGEIYISMEKYSLVHFFSDSAGYLREVTCGQCLIKIKIII